MKTTIVRYQTKPERAEENQQLIEVVFAELADRQPKGFSYQALRLEDGVSFVHLVTEHDVADPDSLQVMPAFHAFLSGIAERCQVQPQPMGATVVGSYQ